MSVAMTKPKQHKCPHCGHDVQSVMEAKQAAVDRAAGREWARMARSLGIRYVRTKEAYLTPFLRGVK